MPYFFYKVRWYLGIALLLCLAITVMKYSEWIDDKLFGTSRRPTNVAQQTMHPGGPGVGGTSGVTAAQPRSPADVRLQLEQARTLLGEARVSATSALEQILTWQSKVEPLSDQPVTELNSTSDEMTKLFDRLSYVRRRERTTARELRDALTQIESLQDKVDGLLKQSTPTALSPVELADVSELHTTCQQAQEEWERDVEQALAIKHLLATQANGTADPSTSTTVGSKLQDANARALVAELDDQIEDDAEQRAAQRAHEAKLEEDRRRKEQEKAELLAKATSPEVQALLAPFLEPRNVQPRLSGVTVVLAKTVDRQPMSLSALYGINALADSEEGLKRLAKLGGHRKLSRPRWSVHSQPGNWTDDDREMLQTAQQMLRDYGAVLVSEGLLSQ